MRHQFRGTLDFGHLVIPTGCKSISPGLRGTSYPGFKRMDDNSERVAAPTLLEIESHSIPNISLVIVDPVPPQQQTKFILETQSFVMRWLITDIVTHGLGLRKPN